VKHSNRRTGCKSRSRSHGRVWPPLPTSIPAACAWTTSKPGFSDLQPPASSFFAFRFRRSPLVRLILCPPRWMRFRFGPVTNGFLRNSPTGSKGRYNAVLATRLVIASTGAHAYRRQQKRHVVFRLSLPNRIQEHLAQQRRAPDDKALDSTSRRVRRVSVARRFRQESPSVARFSWIRFGKLRPKYDMALPCPTISMAPVLAMHESGGKDAL